MAGKGTILHVITGLNRGGAELLLLSTVSRLITRGWQVNVLCLREGYLMPEFAGAGIDVACLETRKGDIRVGWQIREIIKKLQPDLVHVHLFEAELMTYLALLGNSEMPIVASRHGEDNFRRKWQHRVSDMLFFRRCNYILACSEAVEQICLESYNSPSKILLIRNGIDTTQFRPIPKDDPQVVESRKKLGHGLIVGSVGRLSPEKGHHDLIQAWPRVLSVCPGTTLILVGDGPQRKNLMELVEQLNLSECVRFLGALPSSALPLIYASMDVYVQPSLTEGLPLAVLQAMACKLPAVVSNVGGLPDLVQGCAGMVIPPSDVVALAQAICDLLCDPMRQIEMGTYGRQLVTERNDIETNVNRLDELYDAIIKG